MPLPLTVTVSVSTVAPPGAISVKVMVPVGLTPPARLAVSVSVHGLVPSGAAGGVGGVLSGGLGSIGGWTGGSVAKLLVSVCLTLVPLLMYATGLTAAGVAAGPTTWNV